MKRRQPQKPQLFLVSLLILTLLFSACGNAKDAAPASDTPPEQQAEAGQPGISHGEAPTATLPPTELPTATEIPPSPTPALPTPTLPPPGLARANPLPSNSLVSAPGWDVQVLQVLRGAAALAVLQAVRDTTPAPAPGMDYVIAQVKVRNTSSDSAEQVITHCDFMLTGTSLVNYGCTSSPGFLDPTLFATLPGGQETIGWVGFTIPQAEQSLILVFDDSSNFDEGTERFIAIDPGASIRVVPELDLIAANAIGITRAAPAALNQPAVSEDWEVTLLEVMRGEQAWTVLLQVDDDNNPPPQGYEYILARVRLRLLNTADVITALSTSSFSSTGSFGISYDSPWITEPKPAIAGSLYPGGSLEGWVVLLAGLGETNMEMVYEPWLDFSGLNNRFFALDAGASVQIPAGLDQIQPNTLGLDPASPARPNETIITPDWEFTVLEVIRGARALELFQQADDYNDPPEQGFEYILVRARMRLISTIDQPIYIDEMFFKSQSSAGVVYEGVSGDPPEPALKETIYPGAQLEGWCVLQAPVGERGMLLVFEPWLESIDPALRYIALE